MFCETFVIDILHTFGVEWEDSEEINDMNRSEDEFCCCHRSCCESDDVFESENHHEDLFEDVEDSVLIGRE